mmetsp:Transcript_11523/g.15041  ORF Transcript_11523/g.15041 Transcript_11523/m.15041 type:complete len:264 (+) Transcript_11523:182-973(+)
MYCKSATTHFLLFFVVLCAYHCKAFIVSQTKVHKSNHDHKVRNQHFSQTQHNRKFADFVLFAEAEESGEKTVQENEQKKQEVKVDELLTSPAFLKKKIEVLKSTIEKKETEIQELEAEAAKEWEEWGSQIERVQNEMKNIRARSLNDTMAARDDAKVKVLKEAVLVADNFERAKMSIKPETDEEKAVAAQYDAIFQNMEKAFEQLGMTTMETLGQPFDPNFHEAVMSSPSDEYDEDLICQEFQKGYVLGETCIRPAMVVVSLG